MNTNYKKFNVRSNAELTTSYVAGEVIENAWHFNQMYLHIDYVEGSLASCQIKIETSFDGVKYRQLSSGEVANTGVETLKPHVIHLDDSNDFAHPLPIKARFIRISAKGTGTVTGSSLRLVAELTVS